MANPQAALKLVSDSAPSGIRYWRAYFPDPLSGKRRKVSTGVPDDGTKASWADAQAVALQIVEACRSSPKPMPLPPQSFARIADGFWDWGKSPYIAARLARDPRAFGQEYCRNQLSIVRKHAIPILGRYTLREITPAILDDMVTVLLGKVSSATVKHVVNAVGPILDQGVREGAIPFSPVKLMLPFAARSRTRDAFTVREVQQLLNPATVPRVWGSHNYRSFGPESGWIMWSFAVLLFVTGARFSSVAVLRRSDIVEREFSGSKYWEVTLKRSVSQIQGIKDGSKTGEGTVVPIAWEIGQQILCHLPKTGELFASKRGRTGVVSHHTAIKYLHAAMMRIGIEDPQSRLLGFHAFRHAFVTQASAAGMTEKQIQAFTEHKDDSMTDRYRHLKPVDLLAALPVQRGFLAG